MPCPAHLRTTTASSPKSNSKNLFTRKLAGKKIQENIYLFVFSNRINILQKKQG